MSLTKLEEHFSTPRGGGEKLEEKIEPKQEMITEALALEASRELGGFEYFMWKAHQNGCGLIYCIADLSGPITARRLTQAALMCAKRHPNLRAQVSSFGELQIFSWEDFYEKMASHVQVSVISDKSAIQFTEEEMVNTPIAMASPENPIPLWKLTLIQHEGKQQLVSFTHHTIMDGESVILFLKEVVENCAKIYIEEYTDKEEEYEEEEAGYEPYKGAADEDEDEEDAEGLDEERLTDLLKQIEPLPALESQDDLFYDMDVGDGLINAVGFFLRRMAWLIKRPIVPEPEGVTDDIKLRKNRILSTQINGDLYKDLLKRCKEEGTTVTGAIAAAVMLEIKSLIVDKPSAALKMETMVNLRNRIAAEHPEYQPSLALFAAPIDMVISVNEGEELWEKARAYKQDLSYAMEKGQWKKQVSGFQLFRRFNDGIYRMLTNASVGPTQGRVKAAAISNLGPLDEKVKPIIVEKMEEEEAEGWSGKLLSFFRSTSKEAADAGSDPSSSSKHHAFGISRLQWGITEHGIGHYFFVASSSQNGQLNLTITCPSPIISEPRAQGILKGIVTRLLQPAPLLKAKAAAGEEEGGKGETSSTEAEVEVRAG